MSGLRPVREDLDDARRHLQGAWEKLVGQPFPDDYAQEHELVKPLPAKSRMLASLIGVTLDTLLEADQVVRQINGEVIVQIRREAAE